MLKVLICDDEIRVCKLINNLIDWNALDMEVVATVHNGLAAMEAIEEAVPDIVIADIRMPGYGGLDLLRRVHEKGLDISFIIISGYKYFEYAHIALKYGVTDYLLKPIKKDELTRALLSLKEKKEQHIKQHDTRTLLEQELKQSKGILTSQLIELMWQRQQVNTHGLLSLSGKEDMQGSKFCVLMAKFDMLFDLGKDRADAVMDKAHNLLLETLSRCCYECLSEIRGNMLICIAGFSQGNEEKFQSCLSSLHHQLLTHAVKYYSASVTIGVGNTVSELSQINTSFQNARRAVYARVVSGTNKVIQYDALPGTNLSAQIILTPDKIQIFQNIIDAGGRDQLQTFLHEVFQEAMEKNADAELLFSICYELADEFVSRVGKKSGLSRNEIDERLEFGLEESSSVKQIKELLSCIFDDYFDRLEILRSDAEMKPVYLARSYIKDHYANDITLESVAEVVHISPVYLSLTFKKEFNIGFNSYLTGFRINTAKKLLISTDMPIYEIAAAVGYRDAKYFSRVFKSKVGMNPNEFRGFARRW
ncbi:MAG: response regulator [Christensenellales bacterium]